MGKSDQIEALRKGEGVQYLLDTASKIFNNPIVIFDTNYSLIAYTDVITDDPIWNELISTGTFSVDTQLFFAEELFTEAVANADKIARMKSEKLKYDRILGNVFNKDHIKVANMVMVGCGAPIDEEDEEAFEKFSDTVTSEVQNDERFTIYGKTYQEDVLIKLLDKSINNTPVYTGHIQILYDSLTNYLYLAVVDAKQNSGGRDKLSDVKALLERTFESYKFAVFSGYIVMVMSSKNKDLFDVNTFFEHYGLFEQNNLYIGISGRFESLYEIRDYFDEAVTTLKAGIEKNDGQRIFLCNDRQPNL